MKSKTRNLVEKLRDNKIIKNAEHKYNFEVENFGHSNCVNFNHTNLVQDWNQKYSDLIHIDPKQTD